MGSRWGNPEPPPPPENHGPGSMFPPDPLPASPQRMVPGVPMALEGAYATVRTVKLTVEGVKRKGSRRLATVDGAKGEGSRRPCAEAGAGKTSAHDRDRRPGARSTPPAQ